MPTSVLTINQPEMSLPFCPPRRGFWQYQDAVFVSAKLNMDKAMARSTLTDFDEWLDGAVATDLVEDVYAPL
ncbi:hypothetical protein D3C84_1064630 [compost metagenome]